MLVSMWMVRAGENGFLIDDFKQDNIIAIGWEIGDLSDKTRDEIKQIMREYYPNELYKKYNEDETFYHHFRDVEWIGETNKGDLKEIALKPLKKTQNLYNTLLTLLQKQNISPTFILIVLLIICVCSIPI